MTGYRRVSNYFETHTEDQIHRMATLLRQLAEREIGPVETKPSEGWRMGQPASDARQALRAQIWESLKDFPDDCFPIRLPWMNDTKLEFSHPNETGRQLYVNRSFDPNDFSVLSHFLKPGGTFVDIGANAGLYSIYAASKLGPTGHVFAFEPSRREAASLGRNGDLNRLTNLRCLQLAAGAAEGTATLSVADPEFDGHNSLAGLALAPTFPNLRYTVDGQNYHWTSFTGRTTQVALDPAGQLEILIYSEAPFDFVLEDIQLGPEGVVSGPWTQTETHEKPAKVPAPVKTDFSGAHVAMFGDTHLKNTRGAMRIECKSAGGIAFRWQLDPTFSPMVTVTGLPKAETAKEQYTVDVVPLDALFLQPGQPRIDVIKIDVEGFESEVLAGAEKLIASQQPLILIEVANELLDAKKRSAKDVAAQLHALGYVLFDAAEGKPRLVDLMGEHSSNIFAVPEPLLDKMLKLGGLSRKALTEGLGTENAGA